MELLSVIRRWHYRDHFSIREISRMGLSRNTVRKYLRSDTVEPKFAVPDRPSSLDPYADKLSHMLRQEAGKSRKQKRTIKQLHADLVALGYDGSYNRVRPLPVIGGRLGSESRRPPAVACSCPWRSWPARRSSSTGRKIGRSSAGSGPSCRLPTSSSPIAAPSFSGPIRSKPMRCCSTPITTPSACWAGCRGAASTTICAQRSIRSAGARSARSTRAAARTNSSGVG